MPCHCRNVLPDILVGQHLHHSFPTAVIMVPSPYLSLQAFLLESGRQKFSGKLDLLLCRDICCRIVASLVCSRLVLNTEGIYLDPCLSICIQICSPIVGECRHVLVQQAASAHISGILHPAGNAPHRRIHEKIGTIGIYLLDNRYEISLVAGDGEILHLYVTRSVIVIVKLCRIITCSTVKTYHGQIHPTC